MSLLNQKDDNDNPICDIISEKIKNEVVNLNKFDTRYKYVIHTELVQNSGAQCKSSASCNWDANTDDKIICCYKSETFYFVASCFAFYFY